jgi:hypothetical protein
VASFQVRFYERSDRGRLRLLKTVPLPAGRGTLDRAVSWAGSVLANTPADLATRVVEVRVTLAEVQQPTPIPTPTPQ